MGELKFDHKVKIINHNLNSWKVAIKVKRLSTHEIWFCDPTFHELYRNHTTRSAEIQSGLCLCLRRLDLMAIDNAKILKVLHLWHIDFSDNLTNCTLTVFYSLWSLMNKVIIKVSCNSFTIKYGKSQTPYHTHNFKISKCQYHYQKSSVL